MTLQFAWRVGAVIALAAGLGGCTTWTGFGPAAPRIPEPSSVAESESKLNTNVGPNLINYVGAGYYESYKACGDYFDDLVQIQNQVKFAGDVTTAAGTATTSLIALRTNATTAARLVSKWAAGFAFAGTVIGKFDDRALQTPYPTETKTLILGGMQAYENLNPPEKARTQAQAASFVAGHAEMCTYSGIARYAKQALSNATPKTGDVSALSARDQGYVSAILAAMGFPGTTLTIRQLALLDYLVNENPDAYKDAAHTKALLTELPYPIAALFPVAAGVYPDPAKLPQATSVWPLLKTFAQGNPDVKAQLDDIKAAWSKPVTPGKPKVPGINGAADVPAEPSRLTTSVVPAASNRQDIRF